MRDKKERGHIVTIDLPHNFPGGTLKFHKETGEFHIMDKDSEIISSEGLRLDHHYQGNNKKRLLSRLWAGGKYPLTGLNDLDFLSTYDLVYIVDTNELIDNNSSQHNITSFLRAEIKNFPEEHQVEFYERVGYFHFMNINESVHPEKVGWMTLFQQDFFRQDLIKGLTIAVLTDHDLLHLEAYNSKEMPILKDYFLPTGVTLMFAKADKSDTLVNKLLKTADKLSNLYKERFLRNEIVIEPQALEFIDCEKFWFVNEIRSGLCVEPNIIKKSPLIYGENAKVSYFFE